MVATDETTLNKVERRLAQAGLLIPRRVEIALRDQLVRQHDALCVRSIGPVRGHYRTRSGENLPRSGSLVEDMGKKDVLKFNIDLSVLFCRREMEYW